MKTNTFFDKSASSCHWRPVPKVNIALRYGFFSENLVKPLNIQTCGFLWICFKVHDVTVTYAAVISPNHSNRLSVLLNGVQSLFVGIIELFVVTHKLTANEKYEFRCLNITGNVPWEMEYHPSPPPHPLYDGGLTYLTDSP